MNLNDFFDISKPLQVVEVASGQTDGRLRFEDSDDDDYGVSRDQQVRDWVGGFDYIRERRDKAVAVEGDLRATHDVDELEGLTGLTSYEPAENLNVLRAEETEAIFQRYTFHHEPKTHLPVFPYKQEIVRKITSANVCVISGPTGCGKTTQVPQYMLDHCWETGSHCNIVVTQPRRLAAVSIASRVCEERGWPRGTLCGHQIGLNQEMSEDTRLLYCTTGVFLQKLLVARDLSEYTHIFLDEVHERSLELDFVMLIIRQLLHKSDVKVILMSATINPEHFERYFSTSPTHFEQTVASVDTINIGTKSKYPVAIYYLEELDEAEVGLYQFDHNKPFFSDLLASICVKLVKRMDILLDTSGSRKAVLIFLPGILEIENLHKLLVAEMATDPVMHKWKVFPLHSSIPSEQQAAALRRVPADTRKIILATNIAESSITVPDVEFVIDFCLTKRLRVQNSTGLGSLALEWASKHNCIQRAGRVGRVGPGRVYRLLPQPFWNKLLQHSPPEMMTSPLENVVLNSKLINKGEPLTVLAQALDPPPSDQVQRAVMCLKEAGGLLVTANGVCHRTDGDLTFLGRLMSKLPLDVKLSKLIALGYIFGVLEEAIVIAAALSQQHLFSFPFNKKMQAFNSLVTWAYGSSSDHIACLNAYELYKKATMDESTEGPDDGGQQAWAQGVYLQLRALKEMDILIREITRRLKDNTIESVVGKYVPWNPQERVTIIKFAIAGAFYPNYFVTEHGDAESGFEDKPEQKALKVLGGRNPFQTVYLTRFPGQKQPGGIYAGAIKNMFEPCNSIPRVSFETGTEKVFVEFPPESPKNVEDGKKFLSRRIPMAVYLSLMMRKYRIPLELPLLSLNAAHDYAHRMGLKAQRPLCISFRQNPEETTNVEPSNLPRIDTTVIPIQIIEILDPGHFFAASGLVSDSKIWELGNAIQHIRHTPLPGRRPTRGGLYIGAHEGAWARVRVEEIIENRNIAKVLFIDIGKREYVKFSDLMNVGEECSQLVYETPAYAIECMLAKLVPAHTLTHQRRWSDEALDFFKTLTSDGFLYGQVYSVVESVVRIELICTETEGGPQASINERLIEKGFATPAVEGYSSSVNHKLREMPLNPEMLLTHSESQRKVYWNEQATVPPPPAEECPNKVSLGGPISPLEMKVHPMIERHRSLKVNVGGDSVNAILLDEWPEDPRSTMLVASHVTQNIASETITVHQTTVMPDVPGLSALVAVLFAPRAEYRLNDSGSRCAAALCGLGPGPDGKSLFPENDISVAFDVDFTVEDLKTVNVLRNEMSKLLLTDTAMEFPNHSRPELIEAVKRMRKCFSMLLKTRPAQSLEFPRRRLQWGINSLVVPFGDPEDAELIYPPHQLPALEDYGPALDEIFLMATGDEEFSPKTCPLCGDRLVLLKQLIAHVHSRDHRELEARLNRSLVKTDRFK